jgi:hypothetical protein
MKKPSSVLFIVLQVAASIGVLQKNGSPCAAPAVASANSLRERVHRVRELVSDGRTNVGQPNDGAKLAQWANWQNWGNWPNWNNWNNYWNNWLKWLKY